MTNWQFCMVTLGLSVLILDSGNWSMGFMFWLISVGYCFRYLYYAFIEPIIIEDISDVED